MIPFEKSFASSDKAKFWSPRNDKIPCELYKGSDKKFWFDCNTCFHDFKSSLNNVSNGNWCGYCATPSKKLCPDTTKCNTCYEKTFAKNPKSTYWSPKNILKPNQLFNSNNKKFWFDCECGHDFESALNSVSNGNWCGYCANQKLCEDTTNCNTCYDKTFAKNPKSEFWSPKNTTKPNQVFKGNNKKFWFDCEVCGHEFESSLNNISNGNWCGFCHNLKLCEDTTKCNKCYDKTFAKNPKSKYWSPKNILKPNQLFNSNNKKFWFDCDCGHDFETSLSSVAFGQWCGYCATPSRKLCPDTTKCNTCFQKTFTTYPKSEFWSSKNTLKPNQVFKNTPQKFWFDCEVCGHDFESALSSVSNGNWCGYCANVKLCEDTTKCNICYEKTFATNPKSKFWSPKNLLKPNQLFKSTAKKFWFDCNCGHEFKTSLDKVTNGIWCPYCATPSKKLCPDTTKCNTCFQKTFATDPKSEFWSSKNLLKPHQVFKSTDRKFWFDCEICGHDFESSLGHVSEGTWCPICKNKTEKKLYSFLKSKYPKTIREKSFKWCKGKRFDFIVNNVIFELDGEQHFSQVSNWGCHLETQENDKYKMECAIGHGYKIVRLLQDDIRNDNYDWQKFIIDECFKKDNPDILIHEDSIKKYENHC